MSIDVYSLLRKRFPENEYALMAEVSDASGFHRSNSADFIAVNLWPSRGLAVNGIELKSFRGDWIKELKNPKKAENIFKYCDYFWLLTADETIAKIEEIPVAWGWMTINNEKIYVKKQAPQLTPEQINRHFLCAMLKRAGDKTNFVHINSIQDRINESVERAKTERHYHQKNIEDQFEDLKKNVNEFESFSGLRISSRWDDPQKIAKAVKFVMSGGVENMKKQLDGLKQTTESILLHIDNSLKIYEQNNTVENNPG